MGIDLRLNSPVDHKIMKQLLDEYDAVFLGIGLGATARLGLPGETRVSGKPWISIIRRIGDLWSIVRSAKRWS
jgi:hypothetical protein